ncbi:DUF6894 family protein [Aureimonas glaciei]|uniref:DUF6894 domain-containing protein n=1 Tax=Aureimonas glaciei TaxID=1776957 RepID=A0A916Y2Q6_9HYPH|nr:hypothetical protein [Aureimonas glaciei]GGD28645.1 hypothetical protein GCM10011335_34810 [Aureimonas glaciei]
MRYFLHLIQTYETVRDPEGSVHPNLADARGEAVDAARQMMSGAVRGGWDISDWAIEIADEHGVILDRLPFSSTLRPAERAASSPSPDADREVAAETNR